jgi:hypothetical protein
MQGNFEMRRRKGFEQLNVFVPTKIKRQLERLAKRRKSTQAQVITDLIEEAE